MLGVAWDFLQSLIDNFIQLFEYIGVAAGLCYNMIASLPTWLSSFALATILISIIFMILGRESGGSKND